MAHVCKNYSEDNEACKKCSMCDHACQNYEPSLKFVFGVEAYWVHDRHEQDGTNCHMCIFARNENGRQAINDVLAEANLTGFYRQARLDPELILSLPADDVIITTACIAGWKYEDAEEIFVRLHQHFGNNFFLEVQYHNTVAQAELNKHILAMKKKYGMRIIMGCDSHYIYPEDAQERSDYLTSKGMNYPDEEGWYMDYPDGDEAYHRFAQQCVLPHKEIMEAIENTNVFLEVEEYDNPCFTKDIKMPTLYANLTQEERDKKYDDLIWESWNKTKSEVPEEDWPMYEEEIRRETDIVHVTKHADYFLIGHAVVEQGIKNGGKLTLSGRGSAVSFYTNKLLGFTSVDRIAAKVHMYPERFMSPTRILEAKTLADIDFNVAVRAPFLQAQKEVLGEEHSYPMIAYGTLKPKAAWKMYAKSQNVDFSIANAVSDQIDKYETALKHAEEDEEIDILDYIAKEYHDIYAQSESYRGIISHVTPHACATLLYQGDIRKEIGIIKVKDEICCVMDGKWAEEYKFLKMDWLKVSVVDLIYRVYERVGIKPHSANELLQMCGPRSNVWKIYSTGCTLGVNQVEQPGTSSRVRTFSPTNISELCAFIAAIRPGFKSMYKVFESREPFSYGIKSLDDLIQTKEMPRSFILYQEMSMAVLHYAGIPMAECYEIIKNIAKKRVAKVLKYKEQFSYGMRSKLQNEEHMHEDVAKETTKQIWQILEDSSAYSFNASHSYCVSIDSLYVAYLKTMYPTEFYECYLRILDEKGNKEKITRVKQEAESYFHISFLPLKFKYDGRGIVGDPAHKAISTSISTIKGYGSQLGEILYDCYQEHFSYFVDILQYLDERSIKKSKIEPLINIGYFDEYGVTTTLNQIMDMFDFLHQGTAKIIDPEKAAGKPYRDVLFAYTDQESVQKSIPTKNWRLSHYGIDKIEREIRKLRSELRKLQPDRTSTKDTLLEYLSDENSGENAEARVLELQAQIVEKVAEKERLFKEHMKRVLHACEDCIKDMHLPEVPLSYMINKQIEILGYITMATGEKKDRLTLYVKEVYPLRSKNSSDVWGYKVVAVSVGTGITAPLTVRASLFRTMPLKVGDIIKCPPQSFTKRKDYWYLHAYNYYEEVS